MKDMNIEETNLQEGLDILRAVPRDIRQEILGFHLVQWVADHHPEWEKQHKVRFRSCLTELLILTEAIMFALSSKHFTSRKWSKKAGGSHIEWQDTHHSLPYKIARRFTKHSWNDDTIPIWIVEHAVADYWRSLPREMVLGMLEETRYLIEQQWKEWLELKECRCMVFQHIKI
jgi:hypothetical protein